MLYLCYVYILMPCYVLVCFLEFELMNRRFLYYNYFVLHQHYSYAILVSHCWTIKVIRYWQSTRARAGATTQQGSFLEFRSPAQSTVNF